MPRPIVFSLAFLSSASFAQVAPQPDAAASPDASAIIVNATRVPTPIDLVAASVTVLDKKAIDSAQDMGVTELLLRTPGVSISRNGGYGTNTSLRIRGAESDQTVLVIDGVKMADPGATDGSYNFGNLMIGDISRIEVLRGPQSTLWGSQAIGGVVNVVTALPTQPLEGSFDIEAGSRGTINARAAVGGKSDLLSWRIAAQNFTTSGISAIAPEFGGREKDGYTNRGVSGRALVTLAPGVSADLRGYYSHGLTNIDSTTGDTPEFAYNREFLGYAGLNVDLFGGRLRNRIGYAYTSTDRDNFNPLLPRQETFESLGHNKRIDYQGTLAIAKNWNAVFGVEHESSDFRSVSPPSSLSIPVPPPIHGVARTTDEYLQLNGEVLPGLRLTGGVRHNAYTSYGSRFLFSGGATWALKTGTVLRASYGEGFKAPSLYQLYSQYGNGRLAPVRSTGWEAGVEQHLFGGKASIGGAYFQRHTRNQIIFISCTSASSDPLCVVPGTSTARFGYYKNVARTTARGVELDASAHPTSRITLSGNYSWTLAEDRSPGSGTDGNWLPRRPREEGNGQASYLWPIGLTTGIAVRWAGHSFDDAAKKTRLAGYTLVDLRTELPISRRFTLFARVENLTDKHYETAYRFGTLGRSIYTGLRARL